MGRDSRRQIVTGKSSVAQPEEFGHASYLAALDFYSRLPGHYFAKLGLRLGVWDGQSYRA